jgi:hypothetical protein
MKTFWIRILSWFFLAFLAVSLCFFGTAYLIQYRTLSLVPATKRAEEDQRTSQHGAVAAQKIVLSAKLLALYGATMAAAFAVTGWLVVRKTFTPIRLNPPWRKRFKPNSCGSQCMSNKRS